MHELAEVSVNRPGEDLEFVQESSRMSLLERQRPADEITMVRCPSCEGLRAIYVKRHRSFSGKCYDCRRGKVVRREEFYAFWIERFTPQEISDMARAMWD